MNHAFFSSIDWSDLVQKKIPPPFKPKVKSDTDTRYFDSEFTGESVELTPPDHGVLGSGSGLNSIAEEQEHFPQFSYQESHSAAASSIVSINHWQQFACLFSYAPHFRHRRVYSQWKRAKSGGIKFKKQTNRLGKKIFLCMFKIF